MDPPKQICDKVLGMENGSGYQSACFRNGGSIGLETPKGSGQNRGSMTQVSIGKQGRIADGSKGLRKAVGGRRKDETCFNDAWQGWCTHAQGPEAKNLC